MSIDIHTTDIATVLSHSKRYSMTTLGSIEYLYNTCLEVQSAGILGDFVETGTWRGGSSITMAYAAYKYSQEHNLVSRTTWGFDSFEGMPPLSENDGRGGELNYGPGTLTVTLEEISNTAYNYFGLSPEYLKLIKGWFNTTAPEYSSIIGPISILRMDGDWYESTMDVLQNLYNQLSVGGYLIIDDYRDWVGCRRAVNDFFISLGLIPEDFPRDNLASIFIPILDCFYYRKEA